MIYKHKYLFISTFFILLPGFMHIWPTGINERNIISLTVGYQQKFDILPFSVIQDQAYLSNMNFDFKQIPNQKIGISKLTGKEIHFFVTDIGTGINAYKDKESIQLAFNYIWSNQKLLTKNSTGKTWLTLKGASILLDKKYSLNDLQLRYFISENEKNSNLDYTLHYDENINNINRPIIPYIENIINTLNLDLVLIREPLASQLKQDYNYKEIITYRKEWAKLKQEYSPMPQIVVLAEREFLKNSRFLTKRMINALRKGISWLNLNVNHAAEIYSETVEIEPKTLTIAIENTNFNVSKPAESIKKTMIFLNILNNYFDQVKNTLAVDKYFFWK